VVTGALLEGRYRIDALLAHGGMSAVYRGLDTRLDRPVAIKVMDSRFVGDRTFVDRFKHEARSAAKIHNPNVVAVHDQGVDSGPEGDLVYLVMELVDGGTLRDLLAIRGRLPVPLALTVLEQVLSALAAAHTAGLVHRDVKPENVLIGRRSQQGRHADPAGPNTIIKVGDFGLVRAIAGAGVTSSAVILGTVAYLSPEQVATGAATARSDVYSAAVVLYEMLTGVPPYTGDTAISVAYRHVNDDVPALSESVGGIPAALEDLVLRATRRDPEARPPDAGAFLRELRQLRESLGIPPAAIPVPAGESDMETTDPGLDGPTMRNIPVVTSPAASESSPGPRGTMAMARSDLTPGMPLGATAPSGYPPEGPPVPGYSPPAPNPRRLLVVGLIAALLVAAVGTGAWWLTAGRWAQVPTVANLQVDEAKRVLEEAGLSSKIELARSNDIPAGLVIETKPGGGGDALRGEPVTLVVSAGRPVVPDVRAGVSADEAADAIRAVDLQPRLDGAVNVFDQRIPKDAVVRLEPRPGTQLRIGEQVTVVLSKGPPVAIPNVAGQSVDNAVQTLRDAGFEPRVVQEFSASVDGGKVVRTNPPAGTKLDGDDSAQITVVVSTAVTVPDLSGRTVKDAQDALKALGLSLDVRIGPSKNNSRIFIQRPGGGSRVQPGSTVLVGTNLF
jgi:beta-lactam-binding protein with PASTA domain/serine/threonine protein kinase